MQFGKLLRRSLYLSILMVVNTYNLRAQLSNDMERKQITIATVEAEVSIDGELNETYWASATKATDFYLNQPVDGELAKKQTEVRIFATETSLYVGAVLYDDQNHVIQNLKRDNFGDSDEFAIYIDPFDKKSNGYGFGVNSYGARSEALVSVGNIDGSWDNKWKSATTRMADRWIVEMEIPFKSIRYEDGQTAWGVNFTRNDPSANELHVWSPVPRQFDSFDIGYYGELNWDKAPGASGGNISLIPYATLSLNDASGDTPTDVSFDIGGDAKIALTTGLNLDLTINPDFSQVEVDRQVTNLTRFNIFFPERRQFFIENADIFGGYGQFANQPFYSRRIGLDPSGRARPILYGARLTGNLTEKLRIGAFNIHSGNTENFNGQNYSTLTFEQRVGSRSSVKGIFLNRQGYDGSESISGDYGRNAGGEINLSTSDGKLTGQVGMIQSFKEGISGKNKHLYGRFDYNGQNFRTFLFIQNLGTNYYSDMGFNARVNNFDPLSGNVQRIGYTQVGNMVNYYYYPKESAKVNYHWSGIENFVIINEGGQLNEWYTRFRHFIYFQNTSQLRFRLNHIYRDLVFPFDLAANLIPKDDYSNIEYNVQFNTDQRKALNLYAFVVYGGFYNGNKFTYDTRLQYRVQPWGNFSVGLEQNIISLPNAPKDIKLTLLSMETEINFSTSLFWTTFMQYNTQADNFNINTRLQWRYAPMSDIFLVYTDNYITDMSFQPVGRSLVLKVNYWLNL